MEISSIVTASLTFLAAIVASFFTWLATRPKNRADADLTTVQGFALLTAELRKERIELVAQIEKQAGLIERQSTELVHLRGEVAGLREDIDDILERWRRGDPAPAIEPKGNR